MHALKIKFITKEAHKSIMNLFRLHSSINARYIFKWPMGSRVLMHLTNTLEKLGLRGHHGKMRRRQLSDLQVSTNRFCSACVLSSIQFSAFEVQNTVKIQQG